MPSLRARQVISSLVLLVPVALGLSACVTVPSALPLPLVLDATGEWEGGWWSEFGGGPLRLTLKQDGDRLSGAVEMAGSQSHSGGVAGVIDGSRITLEGGVPQPMELTFTREDQLDGKLLSVYPTTVTVTRRWPIWWKPLQPRP